MAHEVRAFAIGPGCFNLDQLKKQFGPRWAWRFYEQIMSMPIGKYPTAAHARADGIPLPSEIPDDARDVVIQIPKPKPLRHSRSDSHESAMEFLKIARRIFDPEPSRQKPIEPQARQIAMFS